MQKNENEALEKKFLSGSNGFDYEEELKKQIEKEIEEARIMNEKKQKNNFIVETDISKISKEEKFDTNSIYRVFNRKQKTETYVNGEQAKNLIKYIDEYVVMFDHRIIEQN